MSDIREMSIGERDAYTQLAYAKHTQETAIFRMLQDMKKNETKNKSKTTRPRKYYRRNSSHIGTDPRKIIRCERPPLLE